MKRLTLASAIFALATLTGCDTAGEGIGPEGGEVVSADGRLVLAIPEGALDEPVEITIEEAHELPEDALGPAYRVLPIGTVFNGPVHVIYSYGALGMEVDPGDVRLVVEREREWSVMPDRHVFAEESLVSASALYLSSFCAVDRP